MVVVYVDDIIFASDLHLITSEFEEYMKAKFEISMLGELSYFLGFHIVQTTQGIFCFASKVSQGSAK